MKLPTREKLRELLDYDEFSGNLTWKSRHGDSNFNSKYAGKAALNYLSEKGYLRGTLLGVQVLAHKVIWKWLYDEEPDQIDHDNGIRSDNRKINLNAADSASNGKNTKTPITNTSGHIGVRKVKHRNKWYAYISVNRKQISLGYYDDFDSAVAARKAGELHYAFHKNHGRKV